MKEAEEKKKAEEERKEKKEKEREKADERKKEEATARINQQISRVESRARISKQQEKLQKL